MSEICIAGFGSAGYAALAAIRRINPKTAITVIDAKESDLAHPCGLPYSLEGTVDAALLSQDIGLERMGVTKVKGRLAAIAPEEKTLTVGTESGDRSLQYSKLIIATGNRPVIPPVRGLDALIGISAFSLHTAEELELIRNAGRKSGGCVIIGAGAIGLETAAAMARLRVKVTVLEMQSQVLSGVLDQDMAGTVEEYIAGLGIDLRTNTRASEMTASAAGVTVETSAGAVTAGFSVISAGFRADESVLCPGLTRNENGIETDVNLRTSIDGIYAAGDCVSGWSVIDGSVLKAKLATSAYKQGTAAGINAAGGSFEYRGSAGTFVTRIGELEIAGTGYTAERAESLGYSARSGKIRSALLPEYFPGNSDITIKILADQKTGRILGAQAVGRRGAAERINLVSAAIEQGACLEDLSRVEMAYCPAVSEVYDPLMRAADFAMRRINK